MSSPVTVAPVIWPIIIFVPVRVPVIVSMPVVPVVIVTSVAISMIPKRVSVTVTAPYVKSKGEMS